MATSLAKGYYIMVTGVYLYELPATGSSYTLPYTCLFLLN